MPTTTNLAIDSDVYTNTYYRYSGSTGSPNTMPVGFFPFDGYRSTTSYDGVNVNPNNSPWNANSHVNHHLGLSMTVPFVMPYNGQVVDESGEAKYLTFRFSGDDDMWVFVDGVLVLDVGGIHQPVEGTINFRTGEVELSSGYGNRQQDSYSRAATGIDDTSVPLGTKSNIWQSKAAAGEKYSFAGDQWRASTAHTVQIFTWSVVAATSNLELSTNLHLAAARSAQITKEWADGVTPDEKDEAGATVELVRKATAREDAGVAPRDAGSPDVFYAVVDSKQLPLDI